LMKEEAVVKHLCWPVGGGACQVLNEYGPLTVSRLNLIMDTSIRKGRYSAVAAE
jgi:hypothetical protein